MIEGFGEFESLGVLGGHAGVKSCITTNPKHASPAIQPRHHTLEIDDLDAFERQHESTAYFNFDDFNPNSFAALPPRIASFCLRVSDLVRSIKSTGL